MVLFAGGGASEPDASVPPSGQIRRKNAVRLHVMDADFFGCVRDIAVFHGDRGEEAEGARELVSEFRRVLLVHVDWYLQN